MCIFDDTGHLKKSRYSLTSKSQKMCNAIFVKMDPRRKRPKKNEPSFRTIGFEMRNSSVCLQIYACICRCSSVLRHQFCQAIYTLLPRYCQKVVTIFPNYKLYQYRRCAREVFRLPVAIMTFMKTSTLKWLENCDFGNNCCETESNFISYKPLNGKRRVRRIAPSCSYFYNVYYIVSQ